MNKRMKKNQQISDSNTEENNKRTTESNPTADIPDEMSINYVPVAYEFQYKYDPMVIESILRDTHSQQKMSEKNHAILDVDFTGEVRQLIEQLKAQFSDHINTIRSIESKERSGIQLLNEEINRLCAEISELDNEIASTKKSWNFN